MTLHRPTLEERPVKDEPRLALLGAAIMLGIGLIVIGSGTILIVASILLGDTALVIE